MLIVITVILVVVGAVLAVAKGKDKVPTKWQSLTDYVLAMIGVFVGVTGALLLTDFSTRHSESEKTVRLLVVAAEDLSRYDRDIQTFPTVYRAFKERSKSPQYGISDYLRRNPRRLPTLPNLLITSEFALSRLHPWTVQELAATLANLQKMHDEVHQDDFPDDKLPLYVRLMDTETKIAIGLIDLEVGYQTGQVTDETIIKEQQVLMNERLKPHDE